MSATMGGLIKDLRIQKNLSQLEIALALGWKESSRLSRIEQGKVERPPRELLDKITAAMKLDLDEKNRLYAAGNYLPNKEDVYAARRRLGPVVNAWPYPASALDFSWRIIFTNDKLFDLYGLPEKDKSKIEEEMPNVLEMIFTPGFGGNQDNPDFFTHMLVQFIYAQKTRSRERWYLDLVKRMMGNKLFRELWPKAQAGVPVDYEAINFVRKSIKELNFYNFVMPVFNDMRFQIEYYVPADIHTMEYFQIVSKKM